MQDKLNEFLNHSPAAGKIKMPAKVVVHRTTLTPKDIVELKKQGQYNVAEDELCSLECGGIIIASGKIIQKDGEYFFHPAANSKEDVK